MREQLILSLIVVSAAACAGQNAGTTLNMASSPISYSCARERQILVEGDKVVAGSDTRLALGWQDEDGDHYMSWPTGATMEAVEYVMPTNHRSSAFERVYDTSKGRSRVDLRLKKVNVCTASGYTTVLAQFSAGTSLDDLAWIMGIEKHEAREILYSALMKSLTDLHRQTR